MITFAVIHICLYSVRLSAVRLSHAHWAGQAILPLFLTRLGLIQCRGSWKRASLAGDGSVGPYLSEDTL